MRIDVGPFDDHPASLSRFVYTCYPDKYGELQAENPARSTASSTDRL